MLGAPRCSVTSVSMNDNNGATDAEKQDIPHPGESFVVGYQKYSLFMSCASLEVFQTDIAFKVTVKKIKINVLYTK